MFREWLLRPVIHRIQGIAMNQIDFAAGLTAIASQLNTAKDSLSAQIAASGNTSPAMDQALADVKTAADAITAIATPAA